MIRLFEANETVFTHYETVLTDVLSCVVSEEENGGFTLSMTLPIDERISENKILSVPTPRGNQLFRIKNVKKVLKDKKRHYSVSAEHIFYDLRDNFILNIRPTDATAVNALQVILNGTESPHNFTATSDVQGLNTANYVRLNPVQAIIGNQTNSLCNLWGGYLIRDNFEISVKQTSFDRGYEVRLGKNLRGIEQNVDLSDVITKIYPTVVIDGNVVTALPEKYVVSPMAGAYHHSIIKEYRIELTEAEKLLSEEEIFAIMRARSEAQFTAGVDKPKVNYKVDFVELRKTDQYKDLSVLEELDITDTVHVIVDDFDLNLSTRVIKYTWDALGLRFTGIELGNFKPRLTSQTQKIVAMIEKVSDEATDGKIVAMLKAAIERITGHRGGYRYDLFNPDGQPSGTIYMDTEDINTAQNYVVINNHGISFGDSGVANAPTVAIDINGHVVAGSGLFNSIVTNLIQSDIGQSLNLESNQSIINRVTSGQMSSYVADATSGLASQEYVNNAIDAINRANPNLVTNRSDRWEQGNIVSGALVESNKHIRTQSYYPVRAGAVTVKVNPLYQAAIARYSDNYTYLGMTPFATEQTITLPSNQYFKAVLKRLGTDDIVPMAIDTAELKVENASEATHWTPYFGDMTLDEQRDLFILDLSSTNGWTVDTNVFTTQLRATLLLFNEDVTSRYQGASITWYRQYPGEEKAIIGSGPSYNVTAAETDKSATYEVVFSIPANKYYIKTKLGDRILTKGGDFILARVSDDPGISVTASKVLVRDYRDRILSAEATLSIQADKIEQRVEQSIYDSEKNKIEQNITTLTTQVGGVQMAINGTTHSFTATSYVLKDANGNTIMDNALGMANEQNISKHDDCENGYPLIIPLHIGSSTSSIYQALVKWKNSPFRATAKSAASGGGTKTSASGGGTTSSSDGGATLTSASGGGHTTSAGGGHSTSAGGSVGAVYTGPAWEWSNASGHYHQVPSTPNHSHWVYDHSHWVSNHTHSVTVPAHTHTNPNHTHTIDLSHTHGLVFGVVEQAVTSNALTIWVDGVQRGSVNASQGELDITPYLQTTGWHTIELRTTTLKRIDANVFIKSYIRR